MADSVIKVAIQLELMGLTPRSGGGGGASPTQVSESIDIGDIKKVFNSMLGEFRALAQTASQTREALAALTQVKTSPSGASTSQAARPTPSSQLDLPLGGAAESASRAAEAAKAHAAATAADADATAASTKALEDRAESLKEEAAAAVKAADASGEISSTFVELHKHLFKVSESASDAADAVQESGKTFSDLSQRLGGRLSAAGLFTKVLAPVAQDPAFRERARQVRSNVERFFDIDASLSDSAKDAAREVQKSLERSINSALRSLSTADLNTNTTKIFSELMSNITEDIKKAERAGTKGVRFRSKEFGEAFKAEEFLVLAAQVEKAAQKFEQAKAAGSDLKDFISDFELSVDRLKRLTSKELGNTKRDTFSNITDSQGRRLNFAQNLVQEINPAGADLNLTKLQKNIVDLAKSSIDAAQPLDVARKVFALLATDVDNFESNIRQVRSALKEIRPEDLGSEEAFVKSQELRNLINVRRTTSGVIKGPNDVAAGQASQIFGLRRIEELRAQTAQGVRGTTNSDIVRLTDSSGNIRKIHVELKQLGSTLDSVRVKAKEVSDNMFDRTSVRTALQRVATWGIAAGVVFGALNAFKQGVQTTVETEFAIASLAKVMDEAQVNFAGFKETATSTAIEISQKFGQPLKDVIETMITFAQQGKNLAQVTELTSASALAANVTTLDQPTAGSVLTSVTEQFGLPIENATSIIDKFNNVANNAAVTETQLAEALKRAGLAAVNAGVDLDQFNGIVAAISEQTRQTGSEIGTALKFVFSRINTPEAEKGLARVGVAVRDAAGNVRPFIDIVSDLRVAFDGLSESQQNQVAIAVAGAHRYNTFLALLANFDQFQKSLENSTNSAGSALREQERIAETASFKIQQLKNSVSAAAVSFGNAFLPVLKSGVGIAKSFFDALTDIPTGVKSLAVSFGLASIAFIKLSDQMVNFIDLFDKGGGPGVFGAVIGASKGAGVSLQQQADKDGARFLREGGVSGAANLARVVDDIAPFRKGTQSAKALADSLREGGLRLADINGKTLQAGNSMTKFAAVVRGLPVHKLDEAGNIIATTTLGIGSLNSGFSKMAATIVRLSGGIANLTGVGQIISSVENRFNGASAATASMVASLAKVGAAFGIISGGIALFNLLKDATLENGESIRAGLAEELAKRQEAVTAVQKQRSEIESLSKAQASAAINAARVANLSPALRDEAVRRGTFKDPFLDEIRLRAKSIEASNKVGFANPEMIKNVDEFGNAVLRSAQAFDVLTTSAKSAEEQLLALTQIQVIEGFIRDLDGDKTDSALKKFGKGFAKTAGEVISDFTLGIVDNPFRETGDDEGKKFRARLTEFQKLQNDPRVKKAQEFGIDLTQVDRDFAEQFDKSARALQDAGIKYRAVIDKVRAEINKLPADTAENLLTSSDFINFTDEIESGRLSSEKGFRVSGNDVRQQLLLQNSKSFSGVRNLIGVNARETQGLFNERGILQRTLDVRKNIEEQLKSVKGGELAILESLLGTPQQLEVVVDEFGNRLGKFLDETTGKIKIRKLSDIISDNKVAEIKLFDPEAIRKQIDAVALELGRVVSGGARGSLIGQDLDLGVLRRFQASGQQRASLQDEGLVQDLLSAREELEKLRSNFKQSIEEGDASVTPQTVADFNQLAIRQDTLDTIFKFRSEVEALGASFEQALDEIDANALKDAIKAQFSGLLGAGRGALESRAPSPLLERELSAEQLFQTQSQGVISTSNRLFDTERAIGDNLAARADLNRNVQLAAKEFASAVGEGGIRDPKQLTQLFQKSLERANAGVDVGQNLLAAIADNQLSEAQKQTKLLEQLVTNDKTPDQLGAGLLAGAQQARAGGQIGAFSASVNSINPDTFAKIGNTQALLEAAKVLQEKTPDALRQELIRRRAGTEAANLAGAALSRANAPTGSASGDTNLFSTKQIADAQAAIATSNQSTLQPVLAKFASGTGKLTEDVAIQAAKEFATALEGLGTKGASAAAADIRQRAGARDEDLIREFLTALRNTREIPRGDNRSPAATTERSVEAEAAAHDRMQKVIDSSTRALNDLLGPVRLTQGALHRLAEESTKAQASVRDALLGSAEQVNINRVLGSLQSGIQSGALRGTRGADFEIGKDDVDTAGRIKLTGSELTQRENQGLIAAANEIKAGLDGVKQAMTAIQKNIEVAQALRTEAIGRGDFATASRAELEISASQDSMAVLAQRANEMSNALDAAGESMRKLDAINNLRINITNLVESFRRAQQFQFDTTSIDTALGRSPFSFTRPTFEQFQQGQGGRLTRSERAEADIDARVRSGALSPLDARVERQRAEFDKNEELIAFAQEKENRKFQNEISVAEQIRSQLIEFGTKDPGLAGEIDDLIRQLNDDLANAGDIIKTNVGPQRVTDPRTGQQVTIPASEVLKFRGVEGLEGIKDRVAELASKTQEEADAKRATLISTPIVDTLVSTSGEIVAAIKSLNESRNSDPAVAGAAAQAEALGNLIAEFPKLVESLGSLPDFARAAMSLLGQKPQKLATGGLVKGPGGPREDKVPVMASPGEFVLQASAVRSLGLNTLSVLNQGRMPQRFADGGLVLDVKEEDADLLARALRGREFRFQGPTESGAPIGVFTEDELERKKMELVEQKIKSAPTEDQVAELRRRAMQEGLQRKKLSGGLIFNEAHPGTSVVFDKNGKPILTNAPGAGIPLDSKAVGIDFSSESTFKRDQDRRAKIDELTTLRSKAEEEKKAIEAQRLSRVRGEFDALKLGEVSDAARLGVEANTQRFTAEVQKHLSVLQGLAKRLETAQGREGLREFSREVQNEYLESSIALQRLMRVARNLETKSVSVNHPVNKGVASIMEAAFGESGFVSDSGEVFGDVFLPNHPVFELLRSGQVESLIQAASQAERLAADSSGFLDLDSLQDVVKSSDLGGTSKGLLSFGLGGAKSLKGTAEFALNLPQNLTAAGEAIGTSLNERGLGRTLSATGKGALRAYDNLSTAVSDTLFGLSGQGTTEEALDAISNLGQFTTDILTGGASAKYSRAASKLATGKIKSSFKNVGSDLASGLKSSKAAATLKDLPEFMKALKSEASDLVAPRRPAFSRRAPGSLSSAGESLPTVGDSVLDNLASIDPSLRELSGSGVAKLGDAVPTTGGVSAVLPKKKRTLTKLAGIGLAGISAGALGVPLELLYAAGAIPVGKKVLPAALGFGKKALGFGRDVVGRLGERIADRRISNLLANAKLSTVEDFARAGTSGKLLSSEDLVRLGVSRRAKGLPQQVLEQGLTSTAPGAFNRAALGGTSVFAPGMPKLGLLDRFRLRGLQAEIKDAAKTGGSLRGASKLRGLLRRRDSALLGRELDKLISSAELPSSRSGGPAPLIGDGPESVFVDPTGSGFKFTNAIDEARPDSLRFADTVGEFDARLASVGPGIDPGGVSLDAGFVQELTRAQNLQRAQSQNIGELASLEQSLAAAGEVNARRVNKGRFQKKPGGGVFLDRRYKAQADKAFIADIISRRNSLNVPEVPNALLKDAAFNAGSLEDQFYAKGVDLRALARPGRALSQEQLNALLLGDRGVDKVASRLQPQAIAALSKRGNFRLLSKSLDEQISVKDFAEASIQTLKQELKNPALGKEAKDSLDLTRRAITSARNRSGKQGDFLEITNILKEVDFLKQEDLIEEILKKKASPLNTANSLNKARHLADAEARGAALGKAALPFDPSKPIQNQLLELLNIRGVKKFASGGRISGPGGPTADRVPILASSGEFILSADAVRKLGTPLLEHINKTGSVPFGDLPRFAEGGLVGGSGAQSELKVSVDTQAVSAAISSAVREALQGIQIGVDSEDAASQIADALKGALENITLPSISVDTQGVSVPLDIPTNGIPLDASALQSLNLGDSLGSAVRNRLEAVEGSVSALREDTNKVLDTVEGLNLEGLSEDVAELRQAVQPVAGDIQKLNERITSTKQELYDAMFTQINEAINTLQNVTAGVDARINKLEAQNRAEHTSIMSLVSEARDIASQALSRALAKI